MGNYFKKTHQSRIYEDLVIQIQEAILSEKFKPGDRLPSQRELVKKFETSRATLREALRVLENKGLIEMKLGVAGGAIVKKDNSSRVSESLALLIRHQNVSLQHLMDFRMIVEGFVVEQACLLAGKEDIKKLKLLTDKALGILKTGASSWKPYSKIDAEFHMEIARIAGNPLFVTTLQPIYDNIHTYFYQYLPDDNNVLQDNYDDICRIVKAIEENNPAEAKRIAINHIKNFSNLMEKNGDK